MDGGHHTTDYDGEASDGEAGHKGLNILKDSLLAQPEIERIADGDGDDRDDKNLAEHTHSVDLNLGAGQPEHEERSEDGGKERGDARHADAEGYVATAEERHDVARNTSRAAADEHNADRQRNAIRRKGRNLAEEPRETEGHERHDRKLRSGTDEDVARATDEEPEILCAQREAHGEHDDADDDGLRVALDPRKERGEEEGDDGREDDDKARPGADKPACRKENLIHGLTSSEILFTHQKRMENERDGDFVT